MSKGMQDLKISFLKDYKKHLVSALLSLGNASEINDDFNSILSRQTIEEELEQLNSYLENNQEGF